ERGVGNLGVRAIEDGAIRSQLGQMRSGSWRQSIGAHCVDGDEEDVLPLQVGAERELWMRCDLLGRSLRARAMANGGDTQQARGDGGSFERDGAERARMLQSDLRSCATGCYERCRHPGVASAKPKARSTRLVRVEQRNGQLRGSPCQRRKTEVKE